MSTRYTYRIEEGCTFNEFIMDCARVRPKTPEETKPNNDYHLERLTKAEERWVLVHNMTYSQLQKEAQAAYDEAINSRDSYFAEEKKRRAQYNVMRIQVEAWEPPTEKHVWLKELMLEQIRISNTSAYNWPVPVKLSYPEWQAGEIAGLRRDIEYHRGKHTEEIQRYAERTQWVKDLRKSLTNIEE